MSEKIFVDRNINRLVVLHREIQTDIAMKLFSLLFARIAFKFNSKSGPIYREKEKKRRSQLLGNGQCTVLMILTSINWSKVFSSPALMAREKTADLRLESMGSPLVT